jgi:hypothetical protein
VCGTLLPAVDRDPCRNLINALVRSNPAPRAARLVVFFARVLVLLFRLLRFLRLLVLPVVRLLPVTATTANPAAAMAAPELLPDPAALPRATERAAAPSPKRARG